MLKQFKQSFPLGRTHARTAAVEPTGDGNLGWTSSRWDFVEGLFAALRLCTASGSSVRTLLLRLRAVSKRSFSL